MRLVVVMIILLSTSTAFAATLDVKLADIKDGYEHNISFREEIGSIRLTARYAYSEMNSLTAKDRGQLGVYYDRCAGPWCMWLFDIADYDNVNDVRSNYLGAGPKYKIIDDDEHSLSFSTGILYEYDHLHGEGAGRYSHRVKTSLWNDRLKGVVFYQPELYDSSDYIKKYEINGKIYESLQGYCLNEFRSLIGVIEDECGIMFRFELGGTDD